MTKPSLHELPDERPGQDEPKARRCLRCHSVFESQWAGERICLRCKGSNAWRSGIPARSIDFGG